MKGASKSFRSAFRCNSREKQLNIAFRSENGSPFNAVANPEDGVPLKVKPRTDENVERVRRAHLNDLENVTVFLFASLGYILTNPSATVAIILFRVFTAARLLHTVVYAIFVVPQPARALSWGVGYAITGYMAVQTLLNIRP